ncbi:MAG: hypothetical protein ABL308_03025 [Oceanicaulis sp.]
MPNFSPRLFVVLVALAVWPASIFLFAPRPEAPGEFAEDVVSEDFLLSLYNIDKEACVALASLDRLDVLVVGNSHVYSGIDAWELAQAFPDRQTGVCAFGTWHLGTFDLLIDYLDHHGLEPRRLIWIVDPYFLQKPLNDYLPDQQATLFDPVARSAVFDRWRTNLAQGSPISGVAAATLRAQIDEVEARTRALDREAAEALVLDVEFVHERHQGVYAGVEPDPAAPAALKRICRALSARGIAVDVVVSPMPRPEFVADLPIEFSVDPYGLGPLFQEAMPCIDRLIDRPVLEDWGLDVRFLFNRGFDPEFPYDWIADRPAFEAGYATLPRRRQGAFYDVHHLNRAGARLFTRRVMEDLAADETG